MNREVQKKGGKLYAFFANLSAVFDKINRKKLQRIMEKQRINRRLRIKVGEIYNETRNVVRVNGQMSAKFWTMKVAGQNSGQ